MTAVLSILVIDDDTDRATVVEQGLLGGGYRVAARVAASGDLTAMVAAHQPDVIIIDAEAPDRDTLEHMRVVSRNVPRPIVMFVDRSDVEMTQRAIDAGVSAYIVDGLNLHSVRPVVDVAIARFREFHALRAELERTKAALAGRKTIERAKGMLMSRRGWTEEQAYHAMRKMAMEKSVKLSEVAETIVTAAHLLKD